MKRSTLAVALLGLLCRNAGAVELPATEITPNNQVQMEVKVISGGQVTANLSALVPSGGSFSSAISNAKTEYVASEDHRNGKLVKRKFDYIESGDTLRLSPTIDEDGKIALTVAFSRASIISQAPISTAESSFMRSLILTSGTATSLSVVDHENEHDGKVELVITAVAQGRG